MAMPSRSIAYMLLILLPGVAAPAATRSYTLWDVSSVPSVIDTGADSEVELGVKFKSDVNGTISGIRFYKASTNTGPHAVNLWTVSGRLLASAVSNSESASGWQQVDFAKPIPIAEGVVYVASYHTRVGHYSFTPQYFAQAGVDRASLHALASGVNGGNGVYAYAPTGVFPTSSLNSANYWVDVVFTPNDVWLVSIAVSPTDASIVAGTTNRFTATGRYSDGSLQDLDGLAVWESNDPGVATVTSFGLEMGVSGGTTSVTARLGTISGSAALTVAASPGLSPAPLLVVTSSANPFTAYLPEILRAEGLNEFDVLDLSRVSSTVLSSYDLVLLGDMPLNSPQVAMIIEWVKDGGNLVAMRPDKQLAGLLGLTDAGGTLCDAYLQMNTAAGPGAGLVGDPIQYHGTADRYLLKGAASFAMLYSSATTGTSNPAVTLNTIGRGQAAAFTYDLGRSVVYTRQGNPAWSGQARDQNTPVRSYDLFFGGSRSDPQPDWVDFNNITIPQADEQQRLLVNLILHMMAASKPLPRFWYLPRGLKAAVVMTGDDHGASYTGGATAARFRDYLIFSQPRCNLDNWECVRASAYLFPPTLAANPLTDKQAADAVSRGFEIGVHVNSAPDCSDWNAASLDAIYTAQLSSFAAHYPGVPRPQTVRTHCVSWSDYDSQPQVELKHGIRLDTNYYYYPKVWVNDRPGLFTGSGMPMRFATRTGAVIDVYQVATQMTDESGQSYPLTVDTLLDNALGPQGYYGVFAANMHADEADSPAARAIVASAKARGVPIVSALQILKWLNGRNGSFFFALSWKNDTLTFQVSVASGANGLQVLLPTDGPSGRLAGVSLNDGSVPYTIRVIKGIEYAIFSAGSGGTFQALYHTAPRN
jgi:hypothetical protein